jgi:tetratricopeptide (TPR) repeat protein
MSRWWISLGLAGLAGVQQASPQQTPAPPKPSEEQVQLPPEEDKSQIPKQYSFNPLQSKKEVTVGEFYFKKGDFKAAARRFDEATKWNDGNAEAWLRLGETGERTKDLKAAAEAYEKYLQLAPDTKNASDVRKRLEKLKK